MASSTEIQRLERLLSYHRSELAILEQQSPPNAVAIALIHKTIATLEQQLQAAQTGSRSHQQYIGENAHVDFAVNGDVQGGIRYQSGGVQYNDSSQHHGDNVQGDKTVISGVSNSIFNIKSTFENVSQVINSAPHIAQNNKQELDSALQQLAAVLALAKPEQKQAAEALAQGAKEVAEQAAKPNPDKAKVTITGESLLTAAKNLAATWPVILPLAQQFIDAVSKAIP